jgi:hypothetical protein
MVNRMPEPSLWSFLPHNTPQFVNFRFFHAGDFDADLTWRHALKRDVVDVLTRRRFFLTLQ